ncbi:hypothetical protein [Mucilaginibacter sp.]|jgi:hypothetical protein|uniref:hypothetical protein n=1 Tax=Mucilaginibacter sp. TaxID=1882438 RepID=UPI002BF6753B|nr:hypothetical protein [Mucilaginibacter sp.]HTI58796.1 hypothetical protein [Mucilaginibacter sp.]
MKFKLRIVIFTGILTALLLVIDLKTVNHSAGDKWASFGLGFCSVVFLSCLLSLITSYRKQRTARSGE